MADNRRPTSGRRCRYANCRRHLFRYDGESEEAFSVRTVCDDYCEQCCKKAIVWSREPKVWNAELNPWPDSVRFDSLKLKPSVTRITRPETHRPYGTSASWAVGGGEG